MGLLVGLVLATSSAVCERFAVMEAPALLDLAT
jgi:hypothetical protein